MRLDVIAASLAVTIKGLIDPVVGRVAALEAQQATLDALTARVAELETRAPVPGPPGPPGPAGLDGKDGAPGLDGKSWRDKFTGRFVAGKHYDEGDLVTEDGSTFICLADGSPGKPGTAAGWQLVAKRGDRGRDGGRV